jgi:hypothetical protein
MNASAGSDSAAGPKPIESRFECATGVVLTYRRPLPTRAGKADRLTVQCDQHAVEGSITRDSPYAEDAGLDMPDDVTTPLFNEPPLDFATLLRAARSHLHERGCTPGPPAQGSATATITLTDLSTQAQITCSELAGWPSETLHALDSVMDDVVWPFPEGYWRGELRYGYEPRP